MKFTFTLEGDFYEDMEDLKTFVQFRDMICIIHECKQIIRSRLKHETPSEEEEKTLDRLSAELHKIET